MKQENLIGSLRLGIFSSIILILNSISSFLIYLFQPDSRIAIEQFLKVILALGLVGLYYAILEQFGEEQKIIPQLLKGIIALDLTRFVLEYYLFDAPGLEDLMPLISTFVGIAASILFVIFGIKVLNMPNKRIDYLVYLKGFILSTFSMYALLLILEFFLAKSHPGTLPLIVSFLALIPYSFSLLFFIKRKSRSTQ